MLLENSLYKNQAERDALVKDTELLGNLFWINFLGITILYNVDSNNSRLKAYLLKDKVQLASITDENNDFTLLIKLIEEKNLITNTVANELTRYAAVLKKGTATSIDENQIRLLVDKISITKVKANSVIKNWVVSFAKGKTALSSDSLIRFLYKFAKKADICSEFVDLARTIMPKIENDNAKPASSVATTQNPPPDKLQGTNGASAVPVTQTLVNQLKAIKKGAKQTVPVAPVAVPVTWQDHCNALGKDVDTTEEALILLYKVWNLPKAEIKKTLKQYNTTKVGGDITGIISYIRSCSIGVQTLTDKDQFAAKFTSANYPAFSKFPLLSEAPFNDYKIAANIVSLFGKENATFAAAMVSHIKPENNTEYFQILIDNSTAQKDYSWSRRLTKKFLWEMLSEDLYKMLVTNPELTIANWIATTTPASLLKKINSESYGIKYQEMSEVVLYHYIIIIGMTESVRMSMVKPLAKYKDKPGIVKILAEIYETNGKIEANRKVFAEVGLLGELGFTAWVSGTEFGDKKIQLTDEAIGNLLRNYLSYNVNELLGMPFRDAVLEADGLINFFLKNDVSLEKIDTIIGSDVLYNKDLSWLFILLNNIKYPIQSLSALLEKISWDNFTVSTYSYKAFDVEYKKYITQYPGTDVSLRPYLKEKLYTLLVKHYDSTYRFNETIEAFKKILTNEEMSEIILKFISSMEEKWDFITYRITRNDITKIFTEQMVNLIKFTVKEKYIEAAKSITSKCVEYMIEQNTWYYFSNFLQRCYNSIGNSFIVPATTMDELFEKHKAYDYMTSDESHISYRRKILTYFEQLPEYEFLADKLYSSEVDDKLSLKTFYDRFSFNNINDNNTQEVRSKKLQTKLDEFKDAFLIPNNPRAVLLLDELKNYNYTSIINNSFDEATAKSLKDSIITYFRKEKINPCPELDIYTNPENYSIENKVYTLKSKADDMKRVKVTKQSIEDVQNKYGRILFEIFEDDKYDTEFEDIMNTFVDNGHTVHLQLRDNVLVKPMLEQIISSNAPIKPEVKLTNKEIENVLRMNNFDITQSAKVNFKKTKTMTYKEYFNKIEGLRDSFDPTQLELKTTPFENDTDELREKRTAELYKYYTKNNAHGDVGLKILASHNVNITFPEFDEFIKENPTPTVIPAFHGTGTVAASMILRFGFKVISRNEAAKNGIGFAGRMLGDGIYVGEFIDKACGYVRDCKNFSRKWGQIGYLLECEAYLGKRGTNYSEAGNGGDNIRSVEYCLRDARAQIKIVRAHRVQITSRREIKALYEKHFGTTPITEETTQFPRMFKSFKEILKEKNEMNEQMELLEAEKPQFANNVISFEFMEDKIPVSINKTVDAETFVKKYCKNGITLSVGQVGYIIEINITEDLYMNAVIPSTDQLMVANPEGLRDLYLFWLNKALGIEPKGF